VGVSDSNVAATSEVSTTSVQLSQLPAAWITAPLRRSTATSSKRSAILETGKRVPAGEGLADDLAARRWGASWRTSRARLPLALSPCQVVQRSGVRDTVGRHKAALTASSEQRHIERDEIIGVRYILRAAVHDRSFLRGAIETIS
jgi:hypothetical protein